MGTECPNGCGEYANLAKHWSGNSSCDYPEVSEYKLDVIRGLVMGDACINLQSQEWSGRLDLSVVSKDFAKEAYNELGWLSNRITVREKRGIGKNKQHRLMTYSHPIFKEVYNKWYPNGKKRYPDDLNLNHTILRFWYLGDGSLRFTGAGTPYVSIRVNNESDRRQYLISLFDDLGYKAYCSSKSVRISTEDTPELLSNIEPVEDLKYKWILDKDEYETFERPYYKGPSSE